MNTYRLDLAWDGRPFCGWQVQPNQDSIQGRVEEALSRLFGGENIRVQAAGRTDAGVHALQQIVSFTAEAERKEEQILRGLNALLPPEIICSKVEVREEGFQARRASKLKMYRYRVLHRKIRSPFRHQQTWWISYPLDIELMKEAILLFQGTHDFSAFRAQGCSAKTTIRSIQAARLLEVDDELHFEFEGKGFLRHQVRIMVGTMIELGARGIPKQRILELLVQKDRSLAGQTAPAHGLWLIWTSLLDKIEEIE